MTEETIKERKYVTVTFPTRNWSIKESAAFEEFVRINGADLRRIFIKYGVGVQHPG